ncbi:MAG: hypothetical protein H6838_12875 [Planctomycetes bacterium]|nr:hypothetical protein [Planctomycetota bacterium]MCB9886381.1 hypothetical protein [Planctomycetota bacterium]
MPRLPTTLLPLATIAWSACTPSGGAPPPVIATNMSPTIASTAIRGSTDALAVELLLAGRGDAPATWHRDALPLADAGLATAFDAMAVDHLRSVTFDGAAGPPLLASTSIARLASAIDAPGDTNQNGSNLDETMLQEVRRVVSFAGAGLPDLPSIPLFPWRSRSAELTGPPSAAAGQTPRWTTRDLGDHHVRLDAIAHAQRLRATAVRRLLLPQRRYLFGADPAQGSLGLLALQQLLAAEDTLLGTMFTGGGPLGPLEDARNYDPAADPRWLPAEVEVESGTGFAGTPLTWLATDAASDLRAVSTLLLASTELTQLASPAAAVELPRLFRGRPFALPSPLPTPPSISWSRDIGPLFAFRCGSCHLQQTRGGFSIVDYDTMLLGGNKTRLLQLPFLVPGNSAQSLLVQILQGPPAPFVQMPFGGQLPANEVALVAAWIDGGALRDPLAAPPQPRPGDDLQVVLFRNLAALHLDAATGALHHRYEADGPSQVVTATATGAALRALAALDEFAPTLEYRGDTPQVVLGHAATYAANILTAADGTVVDAVALDGATTWGEADLRGQAAMTAGLLAAAARLPAMPMVRARAEAAATRLLTAFAATTSPLLTTSAHGRVGSYDAELLAEVLTALRLAERAGIAGAAERRAALLVTLRRAMAFAEWDGHGEVLGDGIADTDGDGLSEPAAAGGAHGRLPLLVDDILIDPSASPRDAPLTWSEHVRPLLLGKCGECHMHGNERGGYRLDTRRAVAVAGESMGQLPLLVPGDPDASLFLQKLQLRQPPIGAQMPLQRTPLDATAVTMLRNWIAAGATAR